MFARRSSNGGERRPSAFGRRSSSVRDSSEEDDDAPTPPKQPAAARTSNATDGTWGTSPMAPRHKPPPQPTDSPATVTEMAVEDA